MNWERFLETHSSIIWAQVFNLRFRGCFSMNTNWQSLGGTLEGNLSKYIEYFLHGRFLLFFLSLYLWLYLVLKIIYRFTIMWGSDRILGDLGRFLEKRSSIIWAQVFNLRSSGCFSMNTNWQSQGGIMEGKFSKTIFLFNLKTNWIVKLEDKLKKPGWNHGSQAFQINWGFLSKQIYFQINSFKMNPNWFVKWKDKLIVPEQNHEKWYSQIDWVFK